MLEPDFRQEILKFSNEKFKYKKARPLAQFGTEVLMSFRGVTSAAVFVNNTETFEFDMIASIPDVYPFSNVFDFLADSGLIGQALSSPDFLTNTENEWDAAFILMPLINQQGIIGICLLDTAVHPIEYTADEIVNLKMFNSLLASSISEIMNEAIIIEKTDLLEQLVASRTMHLEMKSKDLTQRLESLTSNLMSSIPHEVRTPINQILGFTKYLKTILSDISDDENDVAEIINDIDDSAERLKRLFENYLFHTNLVLISMNIAEIEDLQKKITYSAQSVIFETVMNLAYNSKREIDITINTIDSPIAIYEVFLVKILEELLSNSIKFSKLGQSINITSFMEMNKYILTIKDFGDGMDFDTIQNIGAYVQFNRDQNEQQGLGLGLSIVSRIVNIYKASWDIKSEINEYTEVMLVLPIPSKEQMSEFD